MVDFSTIGYIIMCYFDSLRTVYAVIIIYIYIFLEVNGQNKYAEENIN